MDEPYLGEIHIIASTYAPKGYAFCNGQLLAINSNQALFSLLGTTFGGNGTTTFGLPDLRSRLPVGTGQLTGGSTYTQGQIAGVEQVTLVTAQLPAHLHTVTGTVQTSDFAENAAPANSVPAIEGHSQFTNGAANAQMGSAAAGTTGNTGGSAGHENRPPYIGLNYVIALTGIYPSRQ